jgi:signal transduction histidine kinase
LTIQAHLTRLVLASLLPAGAAAFLLIGYSYERQEQSVQQNALATTRALTQAVDRELAIGRTALQALATSPYLTNGNLAAFDVQARQALAELPGNNIVVSDASGQQLLNTLSPPGEPLPRHGNPSQLQRVFQTGQPVVSDLYVGPVARQLVIGIDVPVWRDGRVAYVLSMGFFPTRLAEILMHQQLPPSWVVAIFDSQGTVVARTHNPDRYVGQKGAPALVGRLAKDMEGQVETVTLEGINVQMAFSRSSQSNWSVAIGIPSAEFEAPLRSSMLWIVGGTLVLLALGIALARVLAGRIQRAIRALIPPAVALAHGEPIKIARLDLVEAEEVANAMASAAKVLRDREEILAVVTHDLRNPLNTMIMLATAAELEARRLDAERLRASASLMRETAQGMSGLVDDLLAITVAHRGRSMLKMARVNAANVLAKAVQAARPQLEHAGLQVEVTTPPELPDVQVDLDRIVRVFRNLLDNARKYTEPQGRVAIWAEAPPDCVRFYVANSGPALSREQLDNMFQLFWQAQTDRRGTGLGLSISRSIVDTHGGRIWAEPQQGMRVRICVELPRMGAASAVHEAVELTPSVTL